MLLHQATSENYCWNDGANDVASSYILYHVNPQGQRGLL